MTDNVKVLGLRELRDVLTRQIPLEMRGKTLQKALSKGSAIVARDARRRVPVKSGVLKRAIYMTKNKRNSNGVFEERIVSVRSGKKYQKTNKDAYYWRFIEFGRKAFSSKKGRILGNEKSGYFGRSVAGVSPKPFLRPAFESNRQLALSAIVRSLREQVELAAKKARKYRGIT